VTVLACRPMDSMWHCSGQGDCRHTFMSWGGGTHSSTVKLRHVSCHCQDLMQGEWGCVGAGVEAACSRWAKAATVKQGMNIMCSTLREHQSSILFIAPTADCDDDDACVSTTNTTTPQVPQACQFKAVAQCCHLLSLARAAPSPSLQPAVHHSDCPGSFLAFLQLRFVLTWCVLQQAPAKHVQLHCCWCVAVPSAVYLHCAGGHRGSCAAAGRGCQSAWGMPCYVPVLCAAWHSAALGLTCKAVHAATSR
jgi:hypothetical protein